jgi:hypothetical protein
MEDAYVIGIRLALDDGVSAGIATIAGELAALDAAIATTSVNLERLRDFARSVEMPRLTTPSISRSDQGSPPASPANDPIMAPSTPPAAPSRPAPSTEPARENDTVPATAAPPPTRPPTPVAPSPIIRVLAQATSPEPPSAVVPRSISEPPNRTSAPTASPPTTLNVATAPTADGLAGRPPAAFADRDWRPPQPVAPVINVAIAPPVGPSAPVQAERGESRPRMGPVAAADPVAARPPVAPSIPQAPNVTTPRLAASPTYPGASAAPPPRDSLNGPRQGDVYLDGTRLGRWIADRLAGDAGGPQSGITGFDPRLGATWPGASQGF